MGLKYLTKEVLGKLDFTGAACAGQTGLMFLQVPDAMRMENEMRPYSERITNLTKYQEQRALELCASCPILKKCEEAVDLLYVEREKRPHTRLVIAGKVIAI